MLPKVAALSQPALSLDRRDANRRTFKLSFDAADEPGMTPVVILDLSRTGMRIRSTAGLEIGAYLEVALPEAGTVSAKIVRKVREEFEDEYGAEFEEPITEGAVSAALLAAPAAPPPVAEDDASLAVPDEKLSYRARLGILIGLSVAAWLVVGGAIYVIAELL